jgi:hypothetical protein
VISYDASTSPATYSASAWSEEESGIPRVMGDATLLPNGDVILLNGAQVRAESEGMGRVACAVPAVYSAPSLRARYRPGTKHASLQ